MTDMKAKEGVGAPKASFAIPFAKVGVAASEEVTEEEAAQRLAAGVLMPAVGSCPKTLKQTAEHAPVEGAAMGRTLRPGRGGGARGGTPRQPVRNNRCVQTEGGTHKSCETTKVGGGGGEGTFGAWASGLYETRPGQGREYLTQSPRHRL